MAEAPIRNLFRSSDLCYWRVKWSWSHTHALQPLQCTVHCVTHCYIIQEIDKIRSRLHWKDTNIAKASPEQRYRSYDTLLLLLAYKLITPSPRLEWLARAAPRLRWVTPGPPGLQWASSVLSQTPPREDTRHVAPETVTTCDIVTREHSTSRAKWFNSYVTLDNKLRWLKNLNHSQISELKKPSSLRGNENF